MSKAVHHQKSGLIFRRRFDAGQGNIAKAYSKLAIRAA
jgi:hypothetical protein